VQALQQVVTGVAREDPVKYFSDLLTQLLRFSTLAAAAAFTLAIVAGIKTVICAGFRTVLAQDLAHTLIRCHACSHNRKMMAHATVRRPREREGAIKEPWGA
jgi:hypothetical protein